MQTAATVAEKYLSDYSDMPIDDLIIGLERRAYSLAREGYTGTANALFVAVAALENCPGKSSLIEPSCAAGNPQLAILRSAP
jgi:predicted nucleic acid-binding protein